MEKYIKPNEENLVKALKATAKAHNVEFCDWRDGDEQIGIKSESIPVIADVRSIVRSFAENIADVVVTDCGYTTVFFDCIIYRNEVDDNELGFALPHGIEIDWEYE